MWLRDVLQEILCLKKSLTAIYHGSLGAISWTEQVQGLSKVKFLALSCHYVRAIVETGTVKVFYTPSHKNHADSQTNVLGHSMHSIHRASLIVV